MRDDDRSYKSLWLRSYATAVSGRDSRLDGITWYTKSFDSPDRARGEFEDVVSLLASDCFDAVRPRPTGIFGGAVLLGEDFTVTRRVAYSGALFHNRAGNLAPEAEPRPSPSSCGDAWGFRRMGAPTVALRPSDQVVARDLAVPWWCADQIPDAEREIRVMGSRRRQSACRAPIAQAKLLTRGLTWEAVDTSSCGWSLDLAVAAPEELWLPTAYADASERLARKFAASKSDVAAGHTRRLAAEWRGFAAESRSLWLTGLSSHLRRMSSRRDVRSARRRFRYLRALESVVATRLEREDALEFLRVIRFDDVAASFAGDTSEDQPPLQAAREELPPALQETHAAPRETRAGPRGNPDECVSSRADSSLAAVRGEARRPPNQASLAPLLWSATL
jgi:hypothetical protein